MVKAKKVSISPGDHLDDLPKVVVSTEIPKSDHPYARLRHLVEEGRCIESMNAYKGVPTFEAIETRRYQRWGEWCPDETYILRQDNIISTRNLMTLNMFPERLALPEDTINFNYQRPLKREFEEVQEMVATVIKSTVPKLERHKIHKSRFREWLDTDDELKQRESMNQMTEKDLKIVSALRRKQLPYKLSSDRTKYFESYWQIVRDLSDKEIIHPEDPETSKKVAQRVESSQPTEKKDKPPESRDPVITEEVKPKETVVEDTKSVEQIPKKKGKQGRKKKEEKPKSSSENPQKTPKKGRGRPKKS